MQDSPIPGEAGASGPWGRDGLLGVLHARIGGDKRPGNVEEAAPQPKKANVPPFPTGLRGPAQLPPSARDGAKTEPVSPHIGPEAAPAAVQSLPPPADEATVQDAVAQAESAGAIAERVGRASDTGV